MRDCVDGGVLSRARRNEESSIFFLNDVMIVWVAERESEESFRRTGVGG